MKKNNEIKTQELNTIAFFFDSGKIDDCLYGNVIFENFIDGCEISSNSTKVIVSLGDALNYSIYDDISPFIIPDHMCTIDKTEKNF